MIFLCLITGNALILKWYGRDFVVYASNLTLQSCKLYLHQNLSKLLVLLYFLSVIENLFLALLHVPIHMITVGDVQSYLFKSSAIKKLKVQQEW